MMRTFSRAALAAASFFCLLGTATIAVPSFAAEGNAPTGTATAMLAAVTAPLLAVDVRALEAHNPDFSTSGHSENPLMQQADCLATSVYFEAKGEPLNGQLAVAQTIMNRAASGRFPDSYCAVVRQPGQFSFLHHGSMPKAPRDSAEWKRAVAIALIARDGLWKQIAPDALFFHARRVSPGWGKIKVASLGHHIFFR